MLLALPGRARTHAAGQRVSAHQYAALGVSTASSTLQAELRWCLQTMKDLKLRDESDKELVRPRARKGVRGS